MTFLVYDESAFIRDDIRETLEMAFPGREIRVLSNWLDVQALTGGDHTGVTAVLSLSSDDARGFLESGVAAAIRNLVVIADDAEKLVALPEAQNLKFLQRPFSSETLLDMVRSVLSARP